MKTIQSLLLATLLSIGSMATFAGPVNVNSANAEDIAESLNGVGNKKALAIIAYRSTHGEFTTIDSLIQVKGIGEKTVSKNKNLILLK
ncbi:MAG: helix-hairpin-helix domain-containing protein [Methylococcales bacterium]|jgi:competence protein ComEA|nr:helix-hairpin-helix domain-containing protein [Methylococcales bacterium]MBT7410770.1 helix-hairpin-helix domain-containing protein [Methylococcales bacterium]